MNKDLNSNNTTPPSIGPTNENVTENTQSNVDFNGQNNSSSSQQSNENFTENTQNDVDFNGQNNASFIHTWNENVIENTQNNAPSPSPEPSDDSFEDDGYETQSNRSYFQEGADAMYSEDPKNIPNDFLREFIRDTEDIKRHPWTIGLEDEDVDAFKDRNRKLRDEFTKRCNDGRMTNSSVASEGDCVSCKEKELEQKLEQEQKPKSPVQDTSDTTVVTKESKKIEDSSETGEGSKGDWQDSSDITADTEPMDYGWGSED